MDKLLTVNTALTAAILAYANGVSDRVVKIETQVMQINVRLDTLTRQTRTQSDPLIGTCRAPVFVVKSALPTFPKGGTQS